MYQLPDFGVNVSREVDLKRARKLATRERLQYLQDQTSVKTIQEAYRQFANHLKNDGTKIFLGKFGEGFENNEAYEGFYAHNSQTRNMMFFRESGIDSEGDKGYVLHAYMNVRLGRVADFLKNKSLFD